MNRVCSNSAGSLRCGSRRPVSPSAVPMSRTTYQRCARFPVSPGSLTSYSVLFEFFRSDSFRIIIRTRSPLYGRVPMNGFSCQDHSPSSFRTVCFGRNRASDCTRRRGPAADGPPGQVVHRRLVIADRRQDAGHDDFDLRFGPLLDAPLHAVLVGDRESGADADGLRAHEGVGRRRIGREVLSPGTVEEIPDRRDPSVPPTTRPTGRALAGRAAVDRMSGATQPAHATARRAPRTISVS